MTKRTTYADSRTTGSGGQCAAKAPCGSRCCCEAGVNHGLHICKREGCELCHGWERYQAARELAHVAAGKVGA